MPLTGNTTPSRTTSMACRKMAPDMRDRPEEMAMGRGSLVCGDRAIGTKKGFRNLFLNPCF